jgi:hypothetical protein
MPFDHAEFENRLRDLGALGACPACGDDEADRLDPMPFELATPHPGHVAGVYPAICPTCGQVRLFLPAVLEAEERDRT